MGAAAAGLLTWTGALHPTGTSMGCTQWFCDFRHHYLPQARALTAGGEPVSGYAYPPFLAILLVPLGYLPTGVAELVWGGILVGAVFVLGVLGGIFVSRSAPGLLPVWALLLGTSAPVVHDLAWGQVSTILVTAVLAGVLFLERGRPAAAAGLAAVAVAIKYYPLLPVLRMGWGRTRWLLGTAALTLTLVFVLPVPFLGFDGTLDFLRVTWEQALAIQDWSRDNWGSQTLANAVVDWPVVGGAVGARVAWIASWAVAGLVWLLALGPPGGEGGAPGEGGLLEGVVLVFLTLPLVLRPAWLHYLAFLPLAQLLALDRVLRREPGPTRTLAWGLTAFSVAASNVVTVGVLSLGTLSALGLPALGCLALVGVFLLDRVAPPGAARG